MANQTLPLNAIQQRVWEGKLPLEIVLSPSECRTYDQADSYLISYPRLSYLPSLLPRLHAFFSPSLIEPNSKPHEGWFSFEGVPLKWHYPVGLLYDLYAGADPPSKSSADEHPSSHSAGEQNSRPIPWRLTVNFSDWPHEDLVRLDPDGMVMHDAFINSVKEADFLRNGTAKGIMSLSKEDSSGLWKAVQENDLSSYQRISNILLPAPSQPFRNVPIRIFLPLPPDSGSPSLKVLQSPLPPLAPASTSSNPRSSISVTQPQTIGTALHSLLPNLFPSRRIPVLAKPVLHGAVVPMSAPIEDVVRSSAYGDGDQLETDTILRLSEQLLKGIFAIHELGLGHGDLSCRNIAFTAGQLSTLSFDDLYKIIRAPLCEELVQLDRAPLGPSLPKHLIEAAKWDNWTNKDNKDIHIFNFSESFPVDCKLQTLAQPSQPHAPKTFFMDDFDYRINLWRVGCIIYSLIFGTGPFCYLGDDDVLVAQMIDLLGDFPDEWREKWEKMQSRPNSKEIYSQDGEMRLEKKFERKVSDPELMPLLYIIKGLMRFRPVDRISASVALEFLRGR